MTEINTEGLGKIEGLAAVYNKPTLNDRSYADIYKRLLSGKDYRFNEMMRRGGILCEFGHPNQYVADFERTETDPERACAIITDIWEEKKGEVHAKATILDTPAGRVFKAIQPFYTFGFSSRGSYEVDEDGGEGPNGWNQESYVFKGFDIVALPATQGSELAATESLGSKPRKARSARESLDINNIASAANIDPEQVDAELDKIFTKDGAIEPAKLVDLREFAEDTADDDTPVEGISNADSRKNIVLDLQKALADKAELEKKIQTLLFEKAESDATALSLTSQVNDLKAMQAQAQSQIDFYKGKGAEIQRLVDQLIQTHDSAMTEADSALQSEQEKSSSLAAQVAALTQRATQAEDEAKGLYEQAEKQKSTAAKLLASTEQIKKLKASNESLQKQLDEAKKQLDAERTKSAAAVKEAAASKKTASAARESLLDTYSSLYCVDRTLLSRQCNGVSDVAKIRSAAEGLSKEAVRLSGYNVQLQQPKRVVRVLGNEPVEIRDQVDAELMEALTRK